MKKCLSLIMVICIIAGITTGNIDVALATTSNWVVTKEPTQTTAGVAERTVSGVHGNTSIEQKRIPPLSQPNYWTISISNSCTGYGTKSYSADGFTFYEKIPAVGHSWGAWQIEKNPTLSEQGLLKQKCSRNSNHINQQTLAVLTDTSVWSAKITSEPTCSNSGVMTYTSEYGEVTEPIPAGHKWNWTIIRKPTKTETGIASGVCERDSSHTDIHSLPILTNTDIWHIEERTAPTCMAEGVHAYVSEYGEITEPIPQTGHNWGIWTIKTNPTQTDTGTLERSCENDKTHKDTTELATLTDTSVWTSNVTIESTCDTDGVMTYTSEYGEVTEPIPAGHKWNSWSFVLEPTKTDMGMTQRFCSADSSHTEKKILPAITDNSFWTKGKYTAPTTTSDGSQEYISEYGTVTETIPKLPPTPTPSVEPTATPTASPSASPSIEPSAEPTNKPMASPSAEPSVEPTNKPTTTPSIEPSAKPSNEPTTTPSVEPSAKPTNEPTTSPSAKPNTEPIITPTIPPNIDVNSDCIKITATYSTDGALESVSVEKIKVSEIILSQNTETGKVFYWESLESMKPLEWLYN